MIQKVHLYIEYLLRHRPWHEKDICLSVFVLFHFLCRSYLAVVKRLFFGTGLDEELVCQSSILCAIPITVSSNPACLPVSIKSSLKTFM